MRAMPSFSLSNYKHLIDALGREGFAFRTVSEMESGESASVYLRHDIDFSIRLCLPMAELENELGVRSTYYVLLKGPYSLANEETKRALERIRNLGHEVGLHYDLSRYPEDEALWQRTLREEVGVLEGLVGEPIRTVTLHEPHRAKQDPFREGSEWVHPHNSRFQEGLLYVSDSCRAWRDETLLQAFGDSPPERLLLLTHPELWLDGDCADRFQYLEEVVLPQTSPESGSYFREVVPSIWRRHMGVMAHDLRSQLATENVTLTPMDASWVQSRLPELETLFVDFPEVPWGKAEIVQEREGKWDLSFALLHGQEIVAFSFNSLREGSLYVHAFFVRPSLRRKGFGNLLVCALKLESRRRGLLGLRLRVSESNARARGFYEENGFVESAHEVAEQQYEMSWRLA